MYAILDIETTGISAEREKITEIAIYIHDGTKIIDEFVSLINPERHIQPFITNLTGITNEMVRKAPKFYEIAKQIIEYTDNKIIIGHNVSFDYGFIKNEFKNLGYDFQRKTLCTVKLSRKIFPGKKSYSLGVLCDSLGIQIADRHRAAGDALAAVKLFELLLSVDNADKPLFSEMLGEKYSGLNPVFDIKIIEKLPQLCGVYYFFDSNNNLIYIGKSTNIKNRVKSHLLNCKTKKAAEIKSRIADIDTLTTGSELVALLKETDEIKQHQPIYNKAQKRNVFQYGIVQTINNQGYINFKIEQISKKNNGAIASFSTLLEAKSKLEYLTEKYNLCPKLSGLYDAENACFHYSIKKCNGVCIGNEDVSEYNHRACMALQLFQYPYKSFLIIDKGRTFAERSAVLVRQGKYIGFGFFDITEGIDSYETIIENITHYQDNSDTQQIINSYLKSKKFEKLIIIEK